MVPPMPMGSDTRFLPLSFDFMQLWLKRLYVLQCTQQHGPISLKAKPKPCIDSQDNQELRPEKSGRKRIAGYQRRQISSGHKRDNDADQAKDPARIMRLSNRPFDYFAFLFQADVLVSSSEREVHS